MLGLKLNHVRKRGPRRNYQSMLLKIGQHCGKCFHVGITIIMAWLVSSMGPCLRLCERSVYCIELHKRYSKTTYDSALHYDDVIMSEIASQITSLTIVYSTVLSGADQSKHQSSASLAFVWEIHRWPVNYPHKWPVTRKIFPFDDVIMDHCF